MDEDTIDTINAMVGALMSTLDDLQGITLVAVDRAANVYSIEGLAAYDKDACRALAKRLHECARHVDPEPSNWLITIEAPEQ